LRVDRCLGDRWWVNLHDWIDELCDALDVEIDLDEALILDVARDAAHNVDRPAAPITTFLLGYAAARSNADPDEVERLAAAATDLALRWDKSADALDDPVEEVEFDDEGIDEELEAIEA
jgi:hypothetical protein